MNNQYSEILLIGGGHSHLKLLYLAKDDKDFLSKITLISNDVLTFYSGMISSWFEDIYSKEDITIDVFKLCNTLGVKFILGEVTKAAPGTNKVFLSNGTQLEYRIVSYDLGSLSLTDTYSDLIKNSYTIKPFNNASKIKKIFKEKPYGNYCIIGSGVSSIEISGAIAASIGNGAKLDLITKDLGLMPYSQLNLKHSIEKNLKKYPCISIKKYRDLELYNTLYDTTIWAIGPKPHSLFLESGFSTDNKGYMNVNSNLRSISFENVWGAGDCVNVVNLNLKKNGVNAIKEAKVLYFNLKTSVYNEKLALKKYKARKWQLAIYNMGNHIAIFHYGPFVFSGKTAWHIKKWIDTRYIKQYKQLYENK